MGRGKKDKRDRRSSTHEVEAEVEAMSLSDAPSTSQAPPPDPEEEGLSSASVKRKKKKEERKAALMSLQTSKKPEEAKVIVPEPVAPAQPEPVKMEVEEEAGLGLGLSGGKKRPKKKPKGAAAAEPAQQSCTTSASMPPPAGPPRQAPASAWPTPSPTSAPAQAWGGPKGDRPSTAISQSASSASSTSTTAQTPQPSTSYTSIPESKLPRQTDTTVARPEGRYTKYEPVACRFKIPKRIEGNTVPHRKVQILCNYLAMTIKGLKISRYDVSFKPDRPKKMLGKVFLVSKAQHFPNNEVAFDQIKNCYALTPLKNVTAQDRYITNVTMLDPNGKEMKFEVSYKFTGIVDLNTIINYMETGATSLSPPTEAIQCVDVILRQGTLESYVKAGRQFFKRPERPTNLGDGLEIWTGLFQSGIFTSRPFVNIDVAHKGFPKEQCLLESYKEFRLDLYKPLEAQRGRQVEAFTNFLKGLRVSAVINPGAGKNVQSQTREFVINGLVDPANRLYFPLDEGGKVTKMLVAEYFERVKHVRLRYPDLNCVWVGPREKTIYYPMELLTVVYGQAQNKQLNDLQLATMVRQAATPPDERKKKIQDVITSMNYAHNPYFHKFGLHISDKFYPVDAKVLHPPRLEVGGGKSVEPRRGAWIAERVLKPEALTSWGIVAVETEPDRCDFDNIIRLMMSVGRQMGMNVSPPAIRRFDLKLRDLHSAFLGATKDGINFMFVIVSSRGRDYYHRVKQYAEREVGILTQCIKEATIQTRMNQQTARNILLKVNSKLMGINQALDKTSIPKCLRDGGVMVVGADVTHPSPEQSNIPSIAAVTASIDPKCFMYNIELSIQTPKKEMIVEFQDMMVEHLKVYRAHQKALPKKIFVFRDGVSEGQFAQVMNSELQAVLDAYRTIAGPNARPEVLFLLVQKRHHTRLFIPNSANNVDPGTVVDKDIVHASELDFYLVSHHAIKGTARPTRYHAVCNDGRIPHDEVEQLTFYLCHLYSRCTRSVSYPTPTYYAHLACLRARSLTHGEKFDNKELERHPKRLRVMDKILQSSRMFFV
ncbi:protein argonaute-2-like [Ostrinia nubilalis]|uniref:protein argonaute-2-like n=1 Tax=Ostrinia nubilalis TaxID=29057 RepID=UPI0030824611